MLKRTIALVGNPNCGKTTLFNILTGSTGRVSNRAGVTVEKKEGSLRLSDTHFTVVDLPGVYSLFGVREDESVTMRYLQETPPDLILNVADETCLERHLILSSELVAFKIPMMLLLNMHDAALKQNLCVDTKLIEAAFGVPVLTLSAAKGMGLSALYDILLKDIPTPCVPSGDAALFARTLAAHAVSAPPKSDKHQNVWRRMPGYGADAVFLHPFWGTLTFSAVLALIFFLTFSLPGLFSANFIPMHAITAFFAAIPLPPFFSALLTEGILPGIFSVMSFLPQIIILFLLLTILEDCGYMARGVFLTDRLFGSIGLCGNCFIPMLLGFGCSVPAILSARHLPSSRERRGVVMSIPFLSCSARMPIYLFLCNRYFPDCTALVILSLYGIGILVAALSAKFLGGEKNPPPFYAELPPYRMPSYRTVFHLVRIKVKSFALRTGVTLILTSAVVWVLSSFDFSLRPAKTDSMLFFIGNLFAPLFRPLGFANSAAFCALLSGIMAKEAIVSVLSVTGLVFETPAAAYSFLVFVLLYMPCMATISVMRHALSRRAFWFALFYQNSVAYLASCIVYRLLTYL